MNGVRERDTNGRFSMMWVWLGAALSIGVCGLLSVSFVALRDMALLVGPMGSSAVIVCAEAGSPSARSRNVIFGHAISGLTGVVLYKLCGGIPWLSGSLAVAFASSAMLLTKTLHPPGGATALVAVIGGKEIHDLGFLFPLMPVGVSACVIVGVGHMVNKGREKCSGSVVR